ncbi:MAG: hypothetical protein AB7F41_14655 [Methylocystis sp.]|uniref:hypothetical protein n=1 Tax=Methylocystis sp. TaxID=1911079 RepID=UPI003D0B5D65
MSDPTIVAAVRAAATPHEPAPNADVVSRQAHESSIAQARAEAHGAGRAEGESAGVASERARIAAILDSEEAKGREKQARYFAFKTAMAPDEARTALAEAPVAEAPKAPTLLDEMKGVKQPALGADGGRDVSQMSDFEKGAAEARRLLRK